MVREVLSKLTGWQITSIAWALILVPGAVTAAVTFQPVAIVDPTTGKQATVDSGQRLRVFDPVAGYRNSPASFVSIKVSNVGTQCETSWQYIVPSGKALVITAISGYESQTSPSVNASGYFVYDGANCVGQLLTAHYSFVSSGSPRAPVAVDLGVGIVVQAGKTVAVRSDNNFGYTFLHGYLIPASAVPATPSAEVVREPKAITAAEVAAKSKK